MARLTKNQKVALSKIEANKAYTLQDATALVKDLSTTKFDSSVDIDVRLGVTLVKPIKWYVVLQHCLMEPVKLYVF